MWTRFKDMHSGGGSKEPQEIILIEAPQDEAERIFFGKFGHSPYRVTCTCCGDDYSVSESESLEQLTAYDRGCKYVGNAYVEQPDDRKHARPYVKLEDYLKQHDVLVIRNADIKSEWRTCEVPKQGYVWIN